MIFRLTNRWIGKLLSPKYVYCYSTSTAAPQPNILANYLIDSLGFDKQEALTATKKVRCSNSFRNDPNLVINFLKELGLDHSQIKSIVSCSPNILVANVDKTLQPKIKLLQDIGLSRSHLIKVLMSYRSLLVRPLRSQILPPIEYLRNLLGSNELLAKVVWRDSSLLHWSVPGMLAPNVLFLKKMGISENNLAMIMTRCPKMLLREPAFLEKLAEMVEIEYKVSRDSQMIYLVIAVVYSYGKAAVDRKFNIFRSFGWSEENIHLMFRTFPYVVSLSEARLQKVVEYFMTEVGCEIDYLARYPMLFSFSFEKRVKPRLRVRKILLEKGLIDAKLGLNYTLSLSETRFLKRFVLPYKDESTLSLADVEFMKNYILSHNYEMTSLGALDIKSVGRKKKLGKT